MTVAEIARRLETAVDGGRPDATITGPAGIRDAGPSEITFLSDPRYRGKALETRAAAIVAPAGWDGAASAAVLRVADPERAFIRVASWFAPPLPSDTPGTHPTAVIGSDVELGENVSIGPLCVLGDGCRIGNGTVLTAHCVLGRGVAIGANCRLYPMAAIREYCRLGDRGVLHNGVVIGSDGFGYLPEKDGGWSKIPQTGVVVVGDDVEIGANTTVDRARFGTTRIGDGVKIDNLVQVAHNVTIGARSIVAGMTAFAGSVTVGQRVRIGGCAAIGGHLTIGDDAVVAGRSGVTKDVAPGAFVSGFPAMPHKRDLRLQAEAARLPELKQRIAQLEERLRQIENAGDPI